MKNFEQLHIGTFRDDNVWHSEDDGKTWWCGRQFSSSTNVTRDELKEMATSILTQLSNIPEPLPSKKSRSVIENKLRASLQEVTRILSYVVFLSLKNHPDKEAVDIIENALKNARELVASE
jgi:hypothetical protein